MDIRLTVWDWLPFGQLTRILIILHICCPQIWPIAKDFSLFNTSFNFSCKASNQNINNLKALYILSLRPYKLYRNSTAPTLSKHFSHCRGRKKIPPLNWKKPVAEPDLMWPFKIKHFSVSVDDIHSVV